MIGIDKVFICLASFLSSLVGYLLNLVCSIIFGDISKSPSKLGFVEPLFFDLVILEKFCSWTMLLILVVLLPVARKSGIFVPLLI